MTSLETKTQIKPPPNLWPETAAIALAAIGGICIYVFIQSVIVINVIEGKLLKSDKKNYPTFIWLYLIAGLLLIFAAFYVLKSRQNQLLSG